MRHLRLVNEFCTCGARLPEDARFCHKCGKPQRDEPEIEALARDAEPVVEVETAPTPTTAAPPALPTIGFRNPVAVRAAVIASAFATIAGLIPFPGLFHSLWQLVTIAAGGFASVYLYQRRTGDYLSLRGGLQIGWMTGLFCFIVTMVMLTFCLRCLRVWERADCRRLPLSQADRRSPKYFPECLRTPPCSCLPW